MLVGLPVAAFVSPVVVVGVQVDMITVGVSAQSRQSEAIIALLQTGEEELERAGRPLEMGHVKAAGQLVTVAVAKTVVVLLGPGEHVDCVMVIVLTPAQVVQGSVDVYVVVTKHGARLQVESIVAVFLVRLR